MITAHKVGTMAARSLVLQLIWLALCGCSSGQQVWTGKYNTFYPYWDGRDRNLNPPITRLVHAKSQRTKSAEEQTSTIESRLAIENREAELDRLPKYSPEWVALRKRIDAEEDARIARILVICRGCEIASSKPNQIVSSSREAATRGKPSQDPQETGSITPSSE